MCIIVFAYDSHPDYLLAMAANRDEFHARPTAPACFWKEAPQLLAGKDLEHGGTWMGISRRGHLAALTNYRNPAAYRQISPSRGHLVSNYLLSYENALTYIEKLGKVNEYYNGYNLLLMEGNAMWYYSNITGKPKLISPGLHGLSNHLLDTPWPKVQKGKSMLNSIIVNSEEALVEKLFKLLSHREQPADKNLPATGVSLEWERLLSSIFIQDNIYGTRSSTVLLVEHKGTVHFYERTFSSDGSQIGEVHYRFGNWPETC
jgi:uncharacterized protein with NRDE domain